MSESDRPLDDDGFLLARESADEARPDDRIDDERMDEENTLKKEYVEAVEQALEDGDTKAVYELVEPLHPADIADLLELFEREQRYQLAAAITDLIDSATNFEAEIATYLNANREADTPSSGKVTVGCPPSIMSYLLYPELRDFRKTWPGISLVFNSQMFTEALGENDLILVPVRPTQGRLVVRYLGKMRLNVYAYPDSPRDGKWIGLIKQHEMHQPMQKAREIMGGRDPDFRVETLAEVVTTVQSTRLPGLMPHIAAVREPGLARFDPESRDIESQLYLCFHETRRRDPLLRAVADWVASCFTNAPAL